MKNNIRYTLIGAALSVGISAAAQQPLTGCWFPEDIINWSPETDRDAAFNRSYVPLAERFREPKAMKANANQHYGGEICNSTILYPSCGSSPSQGAANFTGYSPCFWQYMDKLVYWAGSAGEGIICPPPAYSIDAAHRNGVKILGNVFFAPSYYGGKSEWVTQMLTVKDGKYIYAEKLFEIAQWFGFDGWFINLETNGSSTSQWAGFVKAFQDAADAAGCGWMEIQWYDAKRTPATPILSVHPNVSQFIEYGAVKDYRSYASSFGCTEEQVLSKIYCGVQCVNSGLTGFNSELNVAFPTSGHVSSLDLFCPEEHTWKDNVSSLLNTADNCGEKAYEAQKDIFEYESNLWVNKNHNPSTISTSWRGISGCILERSVITGDFSSDMCNGLGKHRFIKGEAVATGDWWNPGLQQVLPTWRWWIERGETLTVSEDWDDAWNLGSSYKITGSIGSGDHLMRLYKSEIALDEENVGTITLVYKANEGDVIPVVGTASSVTDDLVELQPVKKETVNGWTVGEYDLTPLAGKTVRLVGVNLKTDKSSMSYKASLGSIRLQRGNTSIARSEASDLANGSVAGNDGMELRLTWNYEGDCDHFDIYVVGAEGEQLVGQTRGHAYYVPRIERHIGEDDVTVKVVPVFMDDEQGNGTLLTIPYAELTAPTVRLRPEVSYGKVGSTVAVDAVATPLPERWEWTLSGGLTMTEETSGETLYALCNEEGMQTIGVTVYNSVGSGSASSELIEVLSDEDFVKVGNVALNKKIDSYSSAANSREMPSNLLDGKTKNAAVSEKWCVANSTDNWVIVDLGKERRIYGFRIYDCKSGPENFENVPNYRISISSDKKNWVEVVDARNCQNIDIKEDFIAPADGRYVRLETWSELPFTMRMWEFEVIGLGDEPSGIADCQGSSIACDGLEVTADGMISLYDMSGRLVAVGFDRVSVVGLATGAYVARCNGTSAKILVK